MLLVGLVSVFLLKKRSGSAVVLGVKKQRTVSSLASSVKDQALDDATSCFARATSRITRQRDRGGEQAETSP
jgi:hypothetical protein